MFLRRIDGFRLPSNVYLLGRFSRVRRMDKHLRLTPPVPASGGTTEASPLATVKIMATMITLPMRGILTPWEKIRVKNERSRRR